ncbi:hypothetical protein CQA53_11000 [Helicobacter didelphidarum]|uniref:Uncharacterized protein n=2 Tax=Helicobacter didelphidarum TaxID=2040648 RepID=A0A3D8I4Z7_9HELI|nr:hypothetical protein CQA53_11000 [Helicobacter didelphidarum]
MQCNTQTQSPYISLEFCSCQQDFTQNLINRRDLGSTGTFINYSMVAVGTGSSELLSKYMDSQGISNKLNKIYGYKLTGNFGIFSYLFKKVEGKDNERAIKEVIFETGVTWGMGKIGKKIVTAEATKQIATRTATRLGITMAGRILGGYVGSVIPIAGTIGGAVAGAWIAGKIAEWWYADEDAQLAKDKAENERIERLEKAYNLKINRINDYLVRNKYIELRILDDIESETLCKEASNLKSSYFKTILLMQSFPNYLDRDKEFYDTLQQKELDTSKDSKERTSKETDKAQSKEPKITPIANAIPITIEIEKCYDGASGNLLKNTTIYLYNHRFKRVVAKGQSDERGKLIVHNVYVGQENTIDKVSFVVDRENFDERVA